MVTLKTFHFYSFELNKLLESKYFGGLEYFLQAITESVSKATRFSIQPCGRTNSFLFLFLFFFSIFFTLFRCDSNLGFSQMSNLSEAAFRRIYEWQHPRDCSVQSYAQVFHFGFLWCHFIMHSITITSLIAFKHAHLQYSQYGWGIGADIHATVGFLGW